MIHVRGAMPGVVRHGRNMMLPVLLDAHAARTLLVTPKVIVVFVAISGPKGVKGGAKSLLKEPLSQLLLPVRPCCRHMIPLGSSEGNIFIFIFCFCSIPFIILVLLSRSLPVLTQIRGHIAVTAPPSP
ncbi:unnamed protein product, partial [Laminaria digitata]